MKVKTDVGIPVPFPTAKCSDRHCPFHGHGKLRGRMFTGEITKDPFHNTVTVEFSRQYYLQKYERYERRRTRLKAHIPPCFAVKKGNIIKIMETRPISKTKNFVIVEVVIQ